MESRRKYARRTTREADNPSPGTPLFGASNDDDPAKVAVEVCYRQLSVRARSRSELADALRRKEIPPDVIEATLDKFVKAGLVDDEAFAESWVQSRHANKGLGRRALQNELRRKGVADDVVAEAVASVDDEAEQDRAAELVRRKLRAMTGLDEQVKIRRLVGLLARKGYSEGLAYRVVRAELSDVPDFAD